MPRSPRSRAWSGVAAALLLAAACGTTTGGGGSGAGVQVVAAESQWGSIAAQVGGARIHVTSVVSNPDADPHDYEPTPADARLVARASYVLVNGAGYDPWVTRLLEASPAPGRRVLTIAELVGAKEGDNPHLWYSPDAVARVVDRVAADLSAIDGAGADGYARQRTDYLDRGLAPYHEAIAAIRQRHPGAPVGATESIFAPLAPALGLNLVTPPGYLKAVSEGADIAAADKIEAQRQVASRQIQALVFNSQNATPDVRQLVDQARAGGIPVVPITETPPSGRTFQDWQTAQLQALLKALDG